jgi:hypothetical protein
MSPELGGRRKVTFEAAALISGGACVLLVAVARLLPKRENTYEADEAERFHRGGWIVPPEKDAGEGR